jgi:DNA (cytosine-5)-methyltransferase 1
MLTFATACSGIGAPEVAWTPLGWKALWCAEVDRAASEVLAYRFPDVPNHGDMLLLAGKIRSREIPAPDVFCAGTPCQAFSVAGLRGGLGDARGQLTIAFIDLANAIDEVRASDGLPPVIIVWENVPGVLNHEDNPLGCFLAGIAGDDDPLEPGPRPEPGRSSAHWTWSQKAGVHRPKWPNAGCAAGPQRAIAWRIKDAQYQRLAQRRRRVFVVASAREGFDPAAILLEFEGLRRDSPPRRDQGEGLTHPTAPCLTSSGRGVERTGDDGGRIRPAAGLAFGGNNQAGPIDVATACNAHGGPHGRLDFESETFVVEPICFSSKDYGADAAVDISPTLRAGGHTDSHANSGIPPAIAFYPTNRQPEFGNFVDVSPPSVLSMAVRRLMPVECERLQGFPDDHTLVPTGKSGKLAADGPRYKQCGNSMATEVMRWIGARITAALQPADAFAELLGHNGGPPLDPFEALLG